MRIKETSDSKFSKEKTEFTQRELSKMIGTDNNTIVKIEKGENKNGNK